MNDKIMYYDQNEGVYENDIQTSEFGSLDRFFTYGYFLTKYTNIQNNESEYLKNFNDIKKTTLSQYSLILIIKLIVYAVWLVLGVYWIDVEDFKKRGYFQTIVNFDFGISPQNKKRLALRYALNFFIGLIGIYVFNAIIHLIPFNSEVLIVKVSDEYHYYTYSSLK